MNIILLLAITIVGVSTVSVIDPNLDNDWKTFKTKFRKRFKNKDNEKTRRLKYENNARIIAEHNKKADNGKPTFRLAMNEYGDMVGSYFFKCFYINQK
jgi:hypothetical protein